jgi:uncharacterized protein (TIGR00255 family)
MIRSMTGYGKSQAALPGRKLTIEIKTLNSKQLDLSLKLPAYFREKELVVRTLVNRFLVRGKVDFYVTQELTGEALNYSVNHDLAMKYHAGLKLLRKEMREDTPLLPLVLRMPDVLESGREEISEEDWTIVETTITQTLFQVNGYRDEEGKALEEDLLKHVQTILQLLDEVDPYEKSRIEEIRQRISKDFAKLSGDFNGAAPDANRFEQELIYYLEKLDITEEKVRLLKHCQYFLETMSQEETQGKKLGFITQEMGREINTIGSKANHAAIQKIVVQMKDELEKIKEQLNNIL